MPANEPWKRVVGPIFVYFTPSPIPKIPPRPTLMQAEWLPCGRRGQVWRHQVWSGPGTMVGLKPCELSSQLLP